MLAVLRQRNFGLLWVGQNISMVGDWVLFVALPFYIYALTGSTLATGIMFIVQTLPRLFFGSVAGVFVDRWNRSSLTRRRRPLFLCWLRRKICYPPMRSTR